MQQQQQQHLPEQQQDHPAQQQQQQQQQQQCDSANAQPQQQHSQQPGCCQPQCHDSSSSSDKQRLEEEAAGDPLNPQHVKPPADTDSDVFVDCEAAPARPPYRRSVSFPSDDAIAIVHHLHPSSSAGDLSLMQDAPAAAEPRLPPSCWQRFKAAVMQLKRDIKALYYAVHDPRTPLLSKLLPWMVLAYALSPLDLIPDFIPVLGLVDDLLLLPLGLWVSYKLIPAQVMEDSRYRAAVEPLLLHKNWVVASLVFALWCCGLLLAEHWLIESYGSRQLQEWQWVVVAGTGGAALLVFVVWAFMQARRERQKREGVRAGLLVGGYDDDSSDDD